MSVISPRTHVINIQPYNDDDNSSSNNHNNIANNNGTSKSYNKFNGNNNNANSTLSTSRGSILYSNNSKYLWVLIACLIILLVIEYTYNIVQRNNITQQLNNYGNVIHQYTQQYNKQQYIINQNNIKYNELNKQYNHTKQQLQSYKYILEQIQNNAEKELNHAIKLLNNTVVNNNKQYNGNDTNTSDDILSYEQLLSLLSHNNEQSAKIESVVRVSHDNKNIVHSNNHNSNSTDDSDTNDNDNYVDSSNTLVDSNDNVYVLSTGSDTNRQTIDTRLLFDLGCMIVTSAVFGYIARLLHQPELCGYLIGGCIVGPGGIKLVSELIQIETISQLGSTFLLFFLGLEFDIGKLIRMKNIALVGGSVQIILSCIMTCIIGCLYLNYTLYSSLFIGCVISMSSTTVVLKTLDNNKQTTNTQSYTICVALLVAQDIVLSILLTLTPLSSLNNDKLMYEISRLLLRLLILSIVTYVFSYIWPICIRILYTQCDELFVISLVAFCVFMSEISERSLSSSAVGSFLSGILTSLCTQQNAVHKAKQLFEPIRDMFAALFFAAIGLLISPSFLYNNIYNIIICVITVHTFKTCIILIVCYILRHSYNTALTVGISLSQIGEFAFVLANQGLIYELIDKNTYLMLLTSTACSLCMTPILLKLAINIIKH